MSGLLRYYLETITAVAISGDRNGDILGLSGGFSMRLVNDNTLVFSIITGVVQKSGYAKYFLLLDDDNNIIETGRLVTPSHVLKGCMFTLSEFDITTDPRIPISNETRYERVPLLRRQLCSYCGVSSTESVYNPGTCGCCGGIYA